jgi:acyl dehydratase
VPAAYDYGPERVAWLGHLVTNWMGDGGLLARLTVQVRRHNLIGDTTWCRGTVSDRALVHDRGEVTLALAAINQRGETIAAGEAVVVLPRRV